MVWVLKCRVFKQKHPTASKTVPDIVSLSDFSTDKFKQFLGNIKYQCTESGFRLCRFCKCKCVEKENGHIYQIPLL